MPNHWINLNLIVEHFKNIYNNIDSHVVHNQECWIIDLRKNMLQYYIQLTTIVQQNGKSKQTIANL
jgi:hypothetical protein